MAVDLSLNATRRRLLLETLNGAKNGGSAPYDVVITLNEVNNRHGTGVLIQHIYPVDSNVLSIRSQSHYGGEQSFGQMQLALPAGCNSRGDIYRWVLDMTAGLQLQRILCVPWEPAELFLALALRDGFEVPLGLYIMDDSNLRGTGIPDEVMAEAIDKATVRLAISSDMREMYELKYRKRFWLAPPTVSTAIEPIGGRAAAAAPAVIIGNIWGRSWLDALRRTVRESDLRVDWYANSPKGGWLQVEPSELLADGIRLRDPVPESELPRILSQYSINLHPNGPDGASGENGGVASLSLPTRIPLILCASDLPVIVLGDPAACAARFVTHFNVGVATPYESQALKRAIDQVGRSEWRERQLKSLNELRPLFRTADMGSWIRKAIDGGTPPTPEFESLRVSPPIAMPRYLPEPPSLNTWLRDFEPVVAALGRISRVGYQPDFVVDVGASTGVWSRAAATIFPNANYVLVEPLWDRYARRGGSQTNGLRTSIVKAGVSSSPGTATLHVDPHMYSSSLFEETLVGRSDLEDVTIPITTLDTIASETKLAGRGMIKLDIQGGELAALEGARNLLAATDVIILEATCDPPGDKVPSLTHISQALDELGFVYFDDVGEWRDPATGWLMQKDVMYISRRSEVSKMRRGD